MQASNINNITLNANIHNTNTLLKSVSLNIAENEKLAINYNVNSNNKHAGGAICKKFLSFIPFKKSKFAVMSTKDGKVQIGLKFDEEFRNSLEFQNISKQENKTDGMIDHIDISISTTNGLGDAIPDDLNSHIPEIISNHDTQQFQKINKSLVSPVYLMRTKIIKYEQNGYFDWHTDFKSAPTHLYNLLIYPPYSICKKYTGGELVIINKEGHEQSIDPKTFTKWTTVVLDLDTKHSVNRTEYLSIKNQNNDLIERIMIKCELHFSEYVINLYEESKAYYDASNYVYPTATPNIDEQECIFEEKKEIYKHCKEEKMDGFHDDDVEMDGGLFGSDEDF